MLREFDKARQEKSGYRRLFFDEGIALYVWYSGRRGEILGFQLTYTDGVEQKAFTWRRDGGFSHDGVDGWDSSRFNRSPLLVPDGVFARDSMVAYLEDGSAELDPDLRDLVISKVRDYGPGR